MNRKVLSFVSLYLILALLSAFAPSQSHPSAAQAQGSPSPALSQSRRAAGSPPVRRGNDR